MLRDAHLVDRSRLVVVIHRAVLRSEDEPDAECTLGRIDIYPCRCCKPGFLLMQFLHEILHVWLYDNHEKLCFAPWTEHFCERVAVMIFKILGGRIRGTLKCTKYRSAARSLWEKRTDACKDLLDRLRDCRGSQLRGFALQL